MKKTFLVISSAVAMIAAAFVVSILFNWIFPSVQKEYTNEALFRPWNDPLMYIYFIQPFLLSAVLIWGWKNLKDRFSGKVTSDALKVTMIYFFVAILPGMMMTISTFKVSLLAIFTWTISGVLQVFVASLIFIRIKN